MSESKNHLGPYERDGDQICGPNALGNQDIIAEIMDPDIGHAERVGDLFAAAPNLLEALQETAAILRASGYRPDAVARAEIAIARAEGGAA